MNILTNIASISCQQAAFLSSKAAFDSLSFAERIKLKLHLKFCTCPTCHDFAKDSTLIDDAVDKVMENLKKEKIELTDEQRNKILESLK